MADTVQYYLEGMLPELDDLEKRGLFTRAEIKAIVKKRQDFEYLLKRRPSLKQDFARYVEYETKLEALRTLRKSALVRDLAAAKEKWKHSLSDRASTVRILHIYDRSLRRFKGDLNLWLQYLEFCRSYAPRRLHKVATRCLRLHPKVPGLWIYAAAWEFEHNLNVTAARALMQRGLRVCPSAENLWVEYFRMELTCVEKIKARRQVLGLDPSRTSVEERGTAPGDESERMETSVLERGDEGAIEEGGEAGEEREISLEDQVSLKLARTVYKNATAAVPSSLTFRQRFVEALDNFDFQGKDELEGEVEVDICRDFAAEEQSWDWVARRHAGSGDRAIQVFEEALQTCPTAQMYELYANFLVESLDFQQLKMVGSGSILHNMDREAKQHEVTHSLLQLYERAFATQILSEALAIKHLELLLRIGKVDETQHFGGKYCDQVKLKRSASLWALHIAVVANGRSSTSYQDKEIADEKPTVLYLFQEALKSVPFRESRRLWLIVLEFYTGQKKYVETIMGMLEKALAGNSGGKHGAGIACAVLNWMLHAQGIKQARQTYLRLLRLPGPSLEFYKLCITIEARLVSPSSMESSAHVRKLFTEAVDLFGQYDTDIWIQYYREELKDMSEDWSAVDSCGSEGNATLVGMRKSFHIPNAAGICFACLSCGQLTKIPESHRLDLRKSMAGPQIAAQDFRLDIVNRHLYQGFVSKIG